MLLYNFNIRMIFIYSQFVIRDLLIQTLNEMGYIPGMSFFCVAQLKYIYLEKNKVSLKHHIWSKDPSC
jgi:hypothetical protein